MLNSSEEKIQYLANIIFFARADGKITTNETGAIELILQNIGAKKAELNKAILLAEDQDYKITFVGHYSDKIKNLEDIIFVSFADDAIDDSANSILFEVAKEIKLTQDQFNFIVKDVKNFISSNNNTAKCSNCNAEIPTNAKFCPSCGNSTTLSSEEKSINVSYQIPPTGISIEFAESTSAGFIDAIREQKNAPIHNTCLKSKKTWYLASWESKNITQTLKLVENLKGMRNRKVYIDGEESRWDDIFGFTWCAERRNSAYKPIEYCFGLDENTFNIWGCKQSRMEWTEWANWFSYGDFEKVGLLKNQIVFKFNKEKIEHELKTNLFKCKHCPNLNYGFVEKILDKFPSEVIIKEGSDWKYKRDYNEIPGAIKVTTKKIEGSITFTDEFYSTGVVPKSISIGIDIIKSVIGESNNFKEIKQILEYNR